ncbi:hypothetical protein NSQ90_17785 [Paenibacillus sp. FSL H7-0737]|uniref:hypothetical protein n=1 Tax=Paenibacillus sp. FSL H7-0737 TaxID=1536775 RepID=UPI000B14D6C2
MIETESFYRNDLSLMYGEDMDDVIIHFIDSMVFILTMNNKLIGNKEGHMY